LKRARENDDSGGGGGGSLEFCPCLLLLFAFLPRWARGKFWHRWLVPPTQTIANRYQWLRLPSSFADRKLWFLQLLG